MKRYTKKLLASFLVFVFLLTGWGYPALAKDKHEVTLDSLSKTSIDMISDSNFKDLKSSVNNMSDKEFDDFITKYIREEKDQNKAKAKLSKLGVSVDFPIVDQTGISLQSMPASDITLTSYSAHRGHDSYYRLFTSFVFSSSESKPATYDVLGMFFDKTMATYYGTNQSSTTYAWLKDSSQYANGTILFNVDDDSMSWLTAEQYVAVYVTPTKAGQFIYGGKFVHTYNTTSTTTSGNASVNFGGTGVTGSIGFSVSTSTVESNWEKSTDNLILDFTIY